VSSILLRHPPLSTLFPYTTLFRSLFRLATAPCAEGTCHLLERDMTANWYGPRGEWGVGSLWSTVMVSQRTLLPVERSELRRYPRSEEHTSELQSRVDIVCRLLLEK